MFSQFPDARVAVTHDDDWCALIGDVCLSNRNGYDVAYSFVKADEQFPDDEELLMRVHRKSIPQSWSPVYNMNYCMVWDPNIYIGFIELVPQNIPDATSQVVSFALESSTTNPCAYLLIHFYHDRTT